MIGLGQFDPFSTINIVHTAVPKDGKYSRASLPDGSNMRKPKYRIERRNNLVVDDIQ
jgi:hypothetical protein